MPARTFAAALAKWSVANPEEPWLFHRRDYDWNWLSWSQVAEQVARGAGRLRGALEPWGGSPRIAFADRLHADAVATALAAQAAGGVAIPVAKRHRTGGLSTGGGWDAWARISAGGDLKNQPQSGTDIVLSAAPSRLDRWTLGESSLQELEHGGDTVLGDTVLGGTALSCTAYGDARRASLRTYSELWRAARQWQQALETEPGPPPERWIVLASAAVDRSWHPILLAWTLLTGAAWVLEHDENAFVQAVLRNRPNLVVAPGSEAGLLALSLREKRHRRWHRIRAVGVSDDAPAPIVLEEEWGGLGVRVVRLAKK